MSMAQETLSPIWNLDIIIVVSSIKFRKVFAKIESEYDQDIPQS